jgi:hypothetical protein
MLSIDRARRVSAGLEHRSTQTGILTRLPIADKWLWRPTERPRLIDRIFPAITNRLSARCPGDRMLAACNDAREETNCAIRNRAGSWPSVHSL